MLQDVPPLPPSIICVKATNCKSLKEVSSLTSEPPKKHRAWFGFHNCTKLDDDAYEAVLKDLKSRIELVANNDGYPHNEARLFHYYLPSKESIINEWFPDYCSREASIIVEVAPDHKISSCLIGCILISQYQSCNLAKKKAIFGWKCYLGKGCNEWEWITTSATRTRFTGSYPINQIPLEMVSDHKIVWYDGEGSNKITEAIKERRRKGTTCNPILKFEFYANTKDNEEVVMKGCGIRWMHVHVHHDGEISPDATHEDYESHDVEPSPQTSTPTFRPSVRSHRRRPPSLTLPPPFFLFFLPYFSISFLLYATPLFVAPPLSAPSSSGENHQRRRNSVPLRHYLRSLRYLLFSLNAAQAVTKKRGMLIQDLSSDSLILRLFRYPRDGKLLVSVVSVESGKAIAKSSKEIDECLLKLIVAMVLILLLFAVPIVSSILGEVTVNMASYVSSNAESPLSLKLETWMVVLLWLVTLGFNCSQVWEKSNIGNLEYIAEY
ncbi:Putative disease resistance protein [Arachis hypogaea]|nr:Putative disease resistance protein [Arachis hypogaea]